MDAFSRDELRRLAESSDKNCVSIYLPTHRAGAEIQQDPIRLKNLLRKAEERLVEGGMRGPEAKDHLQQAAALLTDAIYWRHQSDGLAVFVSSKEFRTYRLPISFDELVIVNDRFHVKPMLHYLTGDGRFYLLALSQGQTRVFQCTRHSIHEMEVQGMPKSMDDFLKFVDEDPANMQFRHVRKNAAVGRSETNTGRGGLFPGHADDEADTKDRIFSYCRMIDNALHEVLREQRAPLVVAAVEFLHPIYKDANNYQHLLGEGILGNPEGKNSQELLAEAWPVVEPTFLKTRQEAIDRYRQLAATPRSSHNLKEIVPAAVRGRVDTLFVAVDHQRWGTFDPNGDTVDVHLETQVGDMDLLDFAATQTLLNSGTVYALDYASMPDQVILAAVMRY